MGERKGTNHYYPPDYDPRKGGLNKFLGTHALRERARKIHLGILIIRFEMPYNIWCDGCNNHIGMGVRYNAEKKKVGMYYTTPVYQFRMKCHLCDNHFEIKTDPGNLDYVIVSGARRQENRWDPTQNGQVVPEDKDTQKRLFDDAMFKLEHGSKDESTAKRVAPVLGKLVDRNEQTWKDDFAANQALRASFRARKKDAIKQEQKDSDLLRKSSLSIKLLPENEEDVRMAALLALAPSRTVKENRERARVDIMTRPALLGSSPRTAGFVGMRTARHIEDREESRKRLKVAVRPKFSAWSRSNSTLSFSDDSIASDVSSTSTYFASSDNSSAFLSPSSADGSGVNSPGDGGGVEGDDEKLQDGGQSHLTGRCDESASDVKKGDSDGGSRTSIIKEIMAQPVHSSSAIKLPVSLVSGEYESSESD